MKKLLLLFTFTVLRSLGIGGLLCLFTFALSVDRQAFAQQYGWAFDCRSAVALNDGLTINIFRPEINLR